MEIIYANNSGKVLKEVLSASLYSSLFVLCDENTLLHCTPLLSEFLPRHSTIVIPCGEEQKNLQTVQFIWDELFLNKADRNSIILCLGGGVVSDMGAFVASTYKRGIRFIFIPTTLLGMVDACYGGKTGIDYKNLKNQIGTFSFPEKIIIDIRFLKTLPELEWVSGYGEILKYALVGKYKLWDRLKNQSFSEIEFQLQEIIKICLQEKIDIVVDDPFEQSFRKTLNFGHSFAHAIETYYLHKGQSVPHGLAVAWGIIMASYLSKLKFGMSNIIFKEIIDTIKLNFNANYFEPNQANEIIGFMRSDKKNTLSSIKLVLLQQISKPLIDVSVSDDELQSAFDYFNQVWKA